MSPQPEIHAQFMERFGKFGRVIPWVEYFTLMRLHILFGGGDELRKVTELLGIQPLAVLEDFMGHQFALFEVGEDVQRARGTDADDFDDVEEIISWISEPEGNDKSLFNFLFTNRPYTEGWMREVKETLGDYCRVPISDLREGLNLGFTPLPDNNNVFLNEYNSDAKPLDYCRLRHLRNYFYRKSCMEESKSPAPVAVMHSLPTVDSIDTTDAIDLVVDGLPAGDVGLLVGPSGAGKTWLVLDIAASVSAGVDVAGDLFVVPRDGLVLGFFLEETKGQIAERLQAIQRGRKLVARHLMGVLGREDFTGPGGRGMSPREKLEKICDAVDYAVAPRLVIIDNAKELLVGSENEGEVVAVLMNVLREVAQRHQCAVLLAHHASEGAIKGGPRKLLDVTAARGHSSWASYSRWSCNMARVPSQGAMRALVKISRVTHDALMPAPRLLIMAQDGDNPLGFQTAPASRNVADRAQEIDRDDLVKAIAALPVPLSKRSTANAIKGSLGVGRDVVVRAIGQAVSAGDLVEQAARGGRGKVVLRA